MLIVKLILNVYDNINLAASVTNTEFYICYWSITFLDLRTIINW